MNLVLDVNVPTLLHGSCYIMERVAKAMEPHCPLLNSQSLAGSWTLEFGARCTRQFVAQCIACITCREMNGMLEQQDADLLDDRREMAN